MKSLEFQIIHAYGDFSGQIRMASSGRFVSSSRFHLWGGFSVLFKGNLKGRLSVSWYVLPEIACLVNVANGVADSLQQMACYLTLTQVL